MTFRGCIGIIGSYLMQAGKLTFGTAGPDLARDAQQAMSAGTDFAVMLCEIEAPRLPRASCEH